MISSEMPGSETAEGAAPAMSAGEHCVPAAALAVDGTPPAAGDDVEYTVRGKVTRLEGDKAYVQAETVNGEPVPAAAAPDADDPMVAAMAADAESEG